MMLLEMRGIEKSFPGVRALREVDLQLAEGEVLALLGENGAGKSTLIKVLSGAHQPDRGQISIRGSEQLLISPHVAQENGVGVIYQEFNLVPGLSARENIFLGQEKTIAGFFSAKSERAAVQKLFDQLGVDFHPDTPCNRLTVAQQQMVEIAKALLLDARILVMDEPSATLTPSEVTRLFEMIAELKARGIGIIYISHRLDEIFEISDRIMVLRDGQKVGEARTSEISRTQLIEMMVGRELKDEFPPRDTEIGEPRLVVKNLTRGEAVRDVSFDVRRGEIVGLTGLVGAGRTETVRLIFGADQLDQGTIELDGTTILVRHPRDAIRLGIGLLTEDRKLQGLVLGHSVRENFALPNLNQLAPGGVVSRQRERSQFQEYIDELRIKTPSQTQRAKFLSGGNQQKVVLAKWLARDCDVLIFDEPTRGIDVGAKYEIYRLMNQLAAEGKAIIMVSSELPEILGMSDRIIVMHNGHVTGEIDDVAGATQQQIMQLAVG